MKDTTKTRISTIMHTEPAAAQQYKKSLKEKNWIVYYFLLSISNYNSEENHRYVYRNQFNISMISKSLGISRSTFYTSLEKLEKAKLLIPNLNKDYYAIPISSSWAQIHQDLLISLLGYSKTQGIDLLRTYLFCLMLFEKSAVNRGFTRRNLIRCLGHSENDDIMYERVEVYLDLLEQWKLIYVNVETITDNLGKHEIFHLACVNKNSEILSKRLNQRLIEKQNPYGLTKEEEDELKV